MLEARMVKSIDVMMKCLPVVVTGAASIATLVGLENAREQQTYVCMLVYTALGFAAFFTAGSATQYLSERYFRRREERQEERYKMQS